MQVPTRRADKIPRVKSDAHITKAKYDDLKAKLERMTKISRPRIIEDVKMLASMGDFSENAGYQIAKGRLRSLNQRILDIEDLLKRAIIIEPSQKERVEIGHLVTIENISPIGPSKTYRVLGSAETNPGGGVISHSSPLGAALLKHRVDDIIEVQIADKVRKYKITKIE